MKRWVELALAGALLAGCGARTAGFARPDQTVRGTAPQAVPAPVAQAAGSPLVSHAAGSLSGEGGGVLQGALAFDIKPFEAAAGTIGRFAKLSEKDLGYGSQLLPIDTQVRAYNIARQWSEDAKQVYIGWGFWKTSLLAQTQHFYYSPSKKKKLIITFKLVTWKHTTQEEDAPKFDLANKILKAAVDGHSWDGRRAHGVAKSAGYTPTGRNEVGVLIHPLVLGPLWVWLDNEDHQYPLLAVKAHSGDVIRDGLQMTAIRYMFSQK